jgi:hypothetical protein
MNLHLDRGHAAICSGAAHSLLRVHHPLAGRVKCFGSATTCGPRLARGTGGVALMVRPRSTVSHGRSDPRIPTRVPRGFSCTRLQAAAAPVPFPFASSAVTCARGHWQARTQARPGGAAIARASCRVELHAGAAEASRPARSLQRAGLLRLSRCTCQSARPKLEAPWIAQRQVGPRRRCMAAILQGSASAHSAQFHWESVKSGKDASINEARLERARRVSVCLRFASEKEAGVGAGALVRIFLLNKRRGPCVQVRHQRDLRSPRSRLRYR